MASLSKETQLALKKLREEISSNKESIVILCDSPFSLQGTNSGGGMTSLLLGDPVGKMQAMASEQKKLGEKEMKYELLIEQERVNQVVREYEELHPRVFETCPICLEDIHLDSSAEAYSPFSCCGNWACKDCSDSCIVTGKVKGCPLCREPIPENQGAYNKRLVKCAERR